MSKTKKIKVSIKSVRRKLRKKDNLIESKKKKEFLYRGNTLKELSEMNFEETIKLFPSRVRRTCIRDEKKIKQMINKIEKVESFRTHIRELPIFPQFIDKKIFIYNGKEFKETIIKKEMIGHILGEFSLTRKIPKHSGPGVGATKSSKFTPQK